MRGGRGEGPAGEEADGLGDGGLVGAAEGGVGGAVRGEGLAEGEEGGDGRVGTATVSARQTLRVWSWSYPVLKHMSWLPSDQRMVLGATRCRKGRTPHIRGSSSLMTVSQALNWRATRTPTDDWRLRHGSDRRRFRIQIHIHTGQKAAIPLRNVAPLIEEPREVVQPNHVCGAGQS